MRREGEGDRTVRLIRLPMGWWFVVTSIVAILLALVIWAIRPSPFSEWLGATGLGSGAPLSILEAWCHGRVAPLTPIGFITLFPLSDLLILVALTTALSVLLILVPALWCPQRTGPRLTRPITVFRPPRIRLRVRTALAAIAILGLYLAWEISAWRAWPLRERYRGQVVAYIDRESVCRTFLRRIENELATIDRGAQPPSEIETRSASARAAEVAARHDQLRRDLSYWSEMAGAYTQLRQKYEEAAADPSRPLPRDPVLRAQPSGPMDWLSRGEYARALAGFEEEIRIYGDYVWAIEGRARILATCPEARLRDGKLAVAAATRAADLTNWKDAYVLSTLAAAHAEAGDFSSAVQWEQRAVDLFTAMGVNTRVNRDRLALYKSGKPYRMRH